MDKLTNKDLCELFDKYCYDYDTKQFTTFGCLLLVFYALSVLSPMIIKSDKI